MKIATIIGFEISIKCAECSKDVAKLEVNKNGGICDECAESWWYEEVSNEDCSD